MIQTVACFSKGLYIANLEKCLFK